jgi:hypothetical protein
MRSTAAVLFVAFPSNAVDDDAKGTLFWYRTWRSQTGPTVPIASPATKSHVTTQEKQPLAIRAAA